MNTLVLRTFRQSHCGQISGMVDPLMLRIRNDNQVFNRVIEFIAIKVMDMLVWCQRLATVNTHNMAVFEDSNAVNRYPFISTSTNTTANVARVILANSVGNHTNTATVHVLIIFKTRWLFIKKRVAVYASKLDRFFAKVETFTLPRAKYAFIGPSLAEVNLKSSFAIFTKYLSSVIRLLPSFSVFHLHAATRLSVTFLNILGEGCSFVSTVTQEKPFRRVALNHPQPSEAVFLDSFPVKRRSGHIHIITKQTDTYNLLPNQVDPFEQGLSKVRQAYKRRGASSNAPTY